MNKKEWFDPEVNELGVEDTEYGQAITSHNDAVYHDGKYTYYSFS
jgi:hypothetical protein